MINSQKNSRKTGGCYKPSLIKGFLRTVLRRFRLQQKGYDLIVRPGKNFHKGRDWPVFRQYVPGKLSTTPDKNSCLY